MCFYTNGRKMDETLKVTIKQMASKADDEILNVRQLPELPLLLPPLPVPDPPVGPPLTVTRGVVSPLISNSSDPFFGFLKNEIKNQQKIQQHLSSLSRLNE